MSRLSAIALLCIVFAAPALASNEPLAPADDAVIGEAAAARLADLPPEVLNEFDPDAIAQETFLRAYRGIRTYRSEGGFHSWLFAIAYRTFASEKRKRHWSAEELQADPELDRDRVTHSDAAAADIARAMRHLREPERACISLCFQSGMSHQEAAITLGYPVGTVKTHISRGKEKRRAHLSAYAPQREVQR